MEVAMSSVDDQPGYTPLTVLPTPSAPPLEGQPEGISQAEMKRKREVDEIANNILGTPEEQQKTMDILQARVTEIRQSRGFFWSLLSLLSRIIPGIKTHVEKADEKLQLAEKTLNREGQTAKVARELVFQDDKWRYTLEEGRELLATKKFTQAIKTMESIEKEHASPELLFMKASAQIREGQLKEANDNLQKARQLSPWLSLSPSLYSMEKRCRAAQDQLTSTIKAKKEKTVEDLEILLKNEPNNKEHLNALLDIFSKTDLEKWLHLADANQKNLRPVDKVKLGVALKNYGELQSHDAQGKAIFYNAKIYDRDARGYHLIVEGLKTGDNGAKWELIKSNLPFWDDRELMQFKDDSNEAQKYKEYQALKAAVDAAYTNKDILALCQFQVKEKFPYSVYMKQLATVVTYDDCPAELHFHYAQNIEAEDETKALKHYQLAAQKGNEAAKKRLPHFQLEARIPYMFNEKVALLEKILKDSNVTFEDVDPEIVRQARAGSGAAIRKMGEIFVKQNKLQKALKFYLLAARKGDAEAMFQVGMVSLTNQLFGTKYEVTGITNADIIKDLEAAAKQGHVQAMHQLGLAYLKANKAKEANEWLSKALDNANIDSAIAMINSYVANNMRKEAVTVYERIMKQNQNIENLDFAIFVVTTPEIRDKRNAVQYLEQQSNSSTGSTKKRICNALGKYYTDTRQYEQSTKWYNVSRSIPNWEA